MQQWPQVWVGIQLLKLLGGMDGGKVCVSVLQSVLRLEPFQGGAIEGKPLLPSFRRLLEIQFQHVRHKADHPAGDALVDGGGGGVQGVV